MEAVGSDVEEFQVGDRVATGRPEEKLSDPRYGCFQQYALTSADTTSKLADDTPVEAGASALLNLDTVAAALIYFFGLDRPVLSGAIKPRNEKIFIYGGSSSSGGFAIQLAVNAGYEVVTTSSPKNHEAVASLKPTAIIDHTQSADKILEDLRSNGPYRNILDCIGTPPVTNVIVEYLSGIGGGNYNSLIPALPGTRSIPKNVELRFESYGWVFNEPENKELKDWFYKELLPQGLAKGVIVPTPVQWVNGGLANAQKALDMMAKGEVSGNKLIMNPWE